MRNLSFVNEGYYHIYNRGVDKRKVFLRSGEYLRFLQTIRNLLLNGTAQSGVITHQESAFNKKLSFMCYFLMPNHYHFLIKQVEDNGISDFMHNLNTSYTKYFNISHKRTGRLFEYTFKAVEIKTDEQLLHVSRYIHLNPLIANLVTNLEKYKWSSYLDYIGLRNGILCNKDFILNFFNDSPIQYKQFVLEQEDYARSLKKLQKVVLE